MKSPLCQLIWLTVFIIVCDVSRGKVIKSNPILNESMKDERHGIKMGTIFYGCDDGIVSYTFEQKVF